ncbi:MAG: hypothetical protein PHH00_02150 [Candidatus Nanoarchaeia archaeon]|nr:hypothetical protein [Candidatus Nanoarchaeia archaeon]
MPPMMPLLIEKLATTGLGTELIYSFVIIVCSLMIYFGTKELYELSSYKGLKYFRLTFLFFAIAYFFRSFIKFILLYFNIKEIHEFSPMLFGNFTLLIFMYFSSLAIFYLLYSVMWKKWNGNPKKVYLFHLLALVISLSVIISRNSWVYLGLNTFLFIIVLIVVYISRKNIKKRAKRHNLYAIYLLLSFFWILNIIDILIPEFLQTFQLVIYLASAFIFLMILYKVLKKSGSD